MLLTQPLTLPLLWPVGAIVYPNGQTKRIVFIDTYLLNIFSQGNYALAGLVLRCKTRPVKGPVKWPGNRQDSLMVIMQYRYLILSLTLLATVSCTGPTPMVGSEKSIPKGRCVVNTDCPPGFRCNDKFCHDIYYPQRRVPGN